MLSPVPAGDSKSLCSIESALIDWRSKNGFKQVVPRRFALLVFLMKFCCVTPVGRRYPSRGPIPTFISMVSRGKETEVVLGEVRKSIVLAS